MVMYVYEFCMVVYLEKYDCEPEEGLVVMCGKKCIIRSEDVVSRMYSRALDGFRNTCPFLTYYSALLHAYQISNPNSWKHFLILSISFVILIMSGTGRFSLYHGQKKHN